MNSKLHDLPSRTLILAFIAIIGAFFIVLAEFPYFRPLFTAGVATLACFTLWEYYQLSVKKGLNPAMLIGLISSVLFIFAVFFQVGMPTTSLMWRILPEVILGLAVLASFFFYIFSTKNALSSIATTIFGILYVAVPLSLFVRIAFFFLPFQEGFRFAGSAWLVYLIAVTKSSDMGGYFIGKSFGKRKLARSLSPNKTLEGAIGGLVASIVVSVILTWIGKSIPLSYFNFNYGTGAILGLLIGFFGEVGDLAESLFKRDAQVKDSGSLPAVGGILDILDSLLFTTPLLYIFLKVNYL